jgi:outer membrane protein TolC
MLPLLLPMMLFAAGEEPLSLKECLDIAAARHPALQAARLDVDVSDAGVAQARAAYYPQASVASTAQRTQTSDLIARAKRTTDSSSPLTASAQMLVYDFGRTPAAVAVAATGKASARENLRLSGTDVLLNVKLAYFEVLRAHADVLIQAASLQMRRDFVPLIARAYERGSRPKFDLSRAETDLESAKLDQVSAAARLEVARKRLMTALGQPDGAWRPLADRLEVEPKELDEDAVLAFALRQRAEVRLARLRVQSESLRRRLASDQNYPSLRINGSYDVSRQFAPSPERVNAWQVGITATVDLFTGFRIQSETKAASLRGESADRVLADVSQTVTLEVRSAFISLREARARIDASRRLLKSARNNLNLAVRQFENGSGGIFDLIDSQNQVLKGRLNLNDSLADYRVSLAVLERAIGASLAEFDER